MIGHADNGRGRRLSVALLVLAVGGWHATVTARDEQVSLPAALDSFLRDEVRGSAADREALVSGAPVIKLLDADRNFEVAVFGAIWVDAPSARYVEQVKNIEEFERGAGFRITKRFSDPPTAADLAALNISDDDFEDLRDCRIGDCALKLDAFALQRLREEVDWQKPSAKADANAIFRQLALDYVRRYRAGGNASLAVYRDHERPTYVANEFRSMIDRLPRLATQERPGSRVVASKMLYSSHYFWTALELRLLLDDPARGRGFWFVTVNRSRSDGLSGFRGRIIGARARGEAQNGMRAALTAVKTKLEYR
jgi:hypothetical protein